MGKYIIAHDLGTTGDKATLFSTDGRLIASSVRAYNTHFFNGTWAEQNPEDWWTAVRETTAAMAMRVPAAEIIAMSFSGHMMGCLPIDAEGRVLRPHILWCDQRATRQAEQLEAIFGLKEFYRITGHRLSASYSLEKIMWLRDNEPETYAKAACFMQAKDYIVYRLTGKVMTDYSDASGTNAFDINSFEWSKPILDAAGIDIGKLPQTMPSTTVAGPLLPEAAAACGLGPNTQVVLGAGDGLTASVGAGSVREGVTYGNLGTSAWIASATKKPLITDRMILFNFAHAVPGMIAPFGTMQAAGGSFGWMKNQICTGEMMEAESKGRNVYDIINREIASAPAGSNGVLFLPYLLGERAPRWNPDAKGCFIGMKMDTTRADMLRSVIEGVGYNLRVILDEFTGAGIVPEDIAVIGGLVKGEIQRSIFADIWNCKVSTLNYTEEGCSIGAAVIGGVGVGEYPSFESVSDFWKVTDTVSPNPENRAVYEAYLKVFNQSYEALTGVFSALSAVK